MKFVSFLAVSLVALSLNADRLKEPIVINEQGSFTIGGSYVTHEGEFDRDNFLSPRGQRAYGDFAYVFYQIPQNAKPYPLVFQHGGAQSKRTWESTPDGREGFNNIFLRKGYGVYLLDQPRSGEANLSTKEITPDTPWSSNPMYGDKTLYILSRIGEYDKNGVPVPNEQFPKGDEAYEKFQQSWSVGSGPLDNDLNAKTLAKLADKLGSAIVVTHSMGGTIGWRSALETDKIKAIVAFEPGGTEFLFPKDEMPTAIKAKIEQLSASALGVNEDEFLKLTKIPILLIYGDYIKTGSNNVGEDKWGSEMAMAERFVDAINSRGGDAEIIHLPKIGVKGNSHFLMQEKNNEKIADIMQEWLRKKGFDK